MGDEACASQYSSAISDQDADGGRERLGFDQTEDDPAEAYRRQQAARPVEALPGVAAAALRDLPYGQTKHRQRDRNIDEEHPSPRTVLGEPSAQHRADRGGDGSEAGPCANRAAALLLRKIGADQGQAAGDEQCAADPLQSAREISCRMSGASPHQAEAAENSTTPAAKILRRP